MQHYDINISASFWLPSKIFVVGGWKRGAHYISLPKISSALFFSAERKGRKKRDVRRGAQNKSNFYCTYNIVGMRTFGGIIIYVANVLFTPLLLFKLFTLTPLLSANPGNMSWIMTSDMSLEMFAFSFRSSSSSFRGASKYLSSPTEHSRYFLSEE